MTAPPTDRELAQAYAQGYQDGRRGLETVLRELFTAFDGDTECTEILDMLAPGSKARAALAKVTQDQPATKGE